MIKCLPKEVQGRLRSGVALPSLQQCVEELILNSIDAEATCVGVRMDMEAFKVQVLDNGSGMSAEDMENVGNRYHTSKCSSVEDLDDLRWYGFRGEALASVVSLATLVEISSRTRTSLKTHVKMFKDGKGMDVFEADAARPSAGTTVVICSFFHNMPVRRKRMDAALEGERIRHRVEAISLMHPSVSFTLKNDCTGAMLVQLPKARNTYHRFIQIHGLGRAQKLREISHARGRFEVVGYIGREGHYNGSLQFLYVNERLLLRTRVHKMLNFLLRRLSSSNQKNNSPEWQSATRSPKHKRSQEPHGVYVVNIKCSYSEYDICLEPAKTLIEFKDWDGILLCVEEAVKAFLSRENLVAVLSHDDLDPPELFAVGNADREGHAGDQATLDCSIGMKLASDSVHRKRQDDNAPEGGVCQESDEEEAEHLWQKPKTESEGSINKERNDEPPCDPARQEPASDNDSTERDESISSESGEGSQTLHKSSSVRLENEELEVTEKGDVRLHDTTSTGDVTLSDLIGQTLPDPRGVTGGHGQASCDRKIGLSDPYVHENLKTRDLPRSSKSVFPQQILAPKCKERSLTFKRKISLDASPDASCQKWHNASVVPSKIHRSVTCQKLSLCQQSGSLEKFRRVYGKSNEMKPPPQETLREHNTRFAQTDSFVFNRQNALVRPKDQQNIHVKETEETRSSCGIPPSLSDFTKLKPAREQEGGKQSLAAKLRHLKHSIVDSKASPQLPGAVSQDSARLNNDGVEDHNNNEGDADDPPGPEPVPGRGASPPLAERVEATPSGDWVRHYDASAGKTVYVNRVTGLSRYEDAATEESKARCTSDITNIAVSVVSETGMEYRCYPFRVELVLPFLPKSRTERVLSSGLDDRDEKGESSNSLTSLYSKWNNPVFVRPPTVAVDISSGQADGLAVKIHNILFPYRFSKAMIQSMKVINQVDKKFLACLINTREEEPAGATQTEGNLLVLVDQHAAHERVRLEHLVADSYEDDPDSPGERRLCSSTISPPLEISLTEEEQRLLRSCLPRLRSSGLEVKLSQAAESQVLVGKVPLCFMEKESNELRRGRPSVIKPIVEVYLREQIELFRSTGTVRGTLPLTVLKVLASLACHGAIKFNDTLSRDECYSLVATLSSCSLPFQCAHGRPSIAPLVDILHLDKDQEEFQKPNLQKLRRMYKAWELYGNR